MAIPVDPEPVRNGNLDVDETPVASYVKADPDVVRYVSHFATCPDANEHRQAPRVRR